MYDGISRCLEHTQALLRGQTVLPNFPRHLSVIVKLEECIASVVHCHFLNAILLWRAVY